MSLTFCNESWSDVNAMRTKYRTLITLVASAAVSLLAAAREKIMYSIDQDLLYQIIYVAIQNILCQK